MRQIVVCALALVAAPTLAACGGDASAGATPPAAGGCSTTLKPGDDMAGTLASAHAGAVICLQAGVYPVLKLANVHPGGYVTLRSARGRGAKIEGIEGQQIDFLSFADLTVRAPILITDSAHDLRFTRDDIGATTCGIYLYAWSPGGISGIAITHSDIHDLDFTGAEGVCSGYGVEAIGGVDDVSIVANTIAHVANDYIQLGGGERWTVDRNLFLGPSLRYAHATVHQDLWQVFGGGADLRFTDNVARNTATQESLLIQQGVYRRVTIANNLFDRDSSGYSVQLFQVEGLRFVYNTFVGSRWGVLFRADDTEAGPGTGYVVEHNIFGATRSAAPDVIEQRGFGTFDYNVSQDGSASGSHSVRRWRARWRDTTDFQPLCLPVRAGYRPTSSHSRGALSRRWHSGCS